MLKLFNPKKPEISEQELAGGKVTKFVTTANNEKKEFQLPTTDLDNISAANIFPGQMKSAKMQFYHIVFPSKELADKCAPLIQERLDLQEPPRVHAAERKYNDTYGKAQGSFYMRIPAFKHELLEKTYVKAEAEVALAP